MSERKSRKTHTAQQKAKVGLEAIQNRKPVNEIAQDHGVHPVQVSQWRKEIQANAHELFDGKRGPKTVTDDSEKERLYSEIGRLKMELDWLKKKSGLCP